MTPRAAWMFEEQYEGTLLRDFQLLGTALARFYGALGWTKFRRHVWRAMDAGVKWLV